MPLLLNEAVDELAAGATAADDDDEELSGRGRPADDDENSNVELSAAHISVRPMRL